MFFREGFWTAVAYFFGRVGLGTDIGLQKPLQDLDHIPIPLTVPNNHHIRPKPGPIFRPPGAADGSNFKCDYSAMKGWVECSRLSRRCWLYNPATREQWSVTSNYEATIILPDGSVVPKTPVGVTRNYTLDVGNQVINADGLNFTLGKVFNGIYPGPWIQVSASHRRTKYGE